MPNRKKRLMKGIESLGKQIEVHKEKMQKAKEEGQIELKGYYEFEIENLKKVQEQKKKILEKT